MTLPVAPRAGLPWLAALLAVTAASSGGCGSQVVGSHGEIYATDSPFTDGIQRRAILGSAAHDMACDPAALRVVLDPFSDTAERGVYVVEGCGARATYMIVVREFKSTCVLVGKVPAEGAPPAPR